MVTIVSDGLPRRAGTAPFAMTGEGRGGGALSRAVESGVEPPHSMTSNMTLDAGDEFAEGGQQLRPGIRADFLAGLKLIQSF